MLLLPPLRPLSIVDLLASDPPIEASYITGGALPKRCKVIFGGEPKVGKTFMALGMARTLALGGTLYEVPQFICPTPVRVGIIEAEVGLWSIRSRGLNIFAGDDKELLRSNLLLLSGQRDFRVDAEGAVEQMVNLVKHYGLNVLMLDPIGNMHGLDGDKDRDVVALMAKIDRVMLACQDQDLSVVFSHHFKKRPTDPRSNYDPLDPNNFVGSQRWGANPDTVVTAARRNIEGFPSKWRIDTRWVFRHAEPIEDQTLVFNAKGNMRVEREERGGAFEPVLV